MQLHLSSTMSTLVSMVLLSMIVELAKAQYGPHAEVMTMSETLLAGSYAAAGSNENSNDDGSNSNDNMNSNAGAGTAMPTAAGGRGPPAHGQTFPSTTIPVTTGAAASTQPAGGGVNPSTTTAVAPGGTTTKPLHTTKPPSDPAPATTTSVSTVATGGTAGVHGTVPNRSRHEHIGIAVAHGTSESDSAGSGVHTTNMVAVILVVVAAVVGVGLAGFVSCYLYRSRKSRHSSEKSKSKAGGGADSSNALALGPDGTFHRVRGQTQVFMVDSAQFEMNVAKDPHQVNSGRSLGGYSEDRCSDNGTIFTSNTSAAQSNCSGSCTNSVGRRTPGPESSLGGGSAACHPSMLQAHDAPIHADLMSSAPSLRHINAASASAQYVNNQHSTKQAKATALAAMEEGLLRHHMNHPLGSISPDDGSPTGVPAAGMNTILWQKRNSNNNPIRITSGGGSQILRHQPLMVTGDASSSAATGAVTLAVPTTGPSAWSVGVSPLLQLPSGYKPVLKMSQPARVSNYVQQHTHHQEQPLLRNPMTSGLAAPPVAFTQTNVVKIEPGAGSAAARSSDFARDESVRLVDQLPASLI